MKQRAARLTAVLGIVVIFIVGPGVGAAAGAQRGKDRDPVLQTYLSANGLLNRGLYELAAAEYREFLSQASDHAKADVARYGLGVSLYRLELYAATVEALAPLYRQSKFEFAAEVATIVGQCNLAMKRYPDAVRAFQWVVKRRGDHALADDSAAGQIEGLYLDKKHADAVVAGQRFITRWPDSPLRDRAEFFYALSTMAKEEYGAAAERFSSLLARSSDGPFADQASLLLAQCHQNDNSLDKSVRAYRKLLAQAGNRYLPDALFGLATLLQQLEKPAEAGGFFDQLLERYPDCEFSDAARFHRGRTWFDQNEFDRATDRFKEVLDAKSKLADQAAYWLAKCEIRKEKFRKAARRLERAIEQYPKSELLAEMHYDRGVALVRAGKNDDAISALNTFRQKFPDHPLVPEALRLAAITEHQRRRFAESQQQCDLFLGKFASHELAPSVAFLAGENEFLSGQNEKAVERYGRFLSRYADNAQALQAAFRLGTALYRLERFDDAATRLAQVVKGADTGEVFRPALLTLGDIHFQRSEWKKAEAYLVDYLSYDDEVALADDALLKLGLSRQRDGRYREAIDAYDSLIARFEKSPHRTQALFERGQALVALERLDEATAAFAAVLDADQNSRFTPYALNHMAAIAAKRGKLDQSSKLYARVAAVASEGDMKAEALFQQGQSFMSSQHFHRAEDTFANFVSQYPSHKRAGIASAKRAIAIARQDRFDDALEAIEDVERRGLGGLDPTLASAVRYEKAWSLRKLGRTDEAAGAYRALTSQRDLDSLGAHAALELAEIEYANERFGDAASLLRRVYDVMHADETEVSRDVQEQATYRLALCEFKLQHGDRAAELFEEFLTTFPDSSLTASACFYGGESLFQLGRHERAVRHLARVPQEFASDPVCGPSLLRLGESLSTMQRWARSEQAFAQYLERFEDSEHAFQARFGLGWARENQKRYDEAITAYRLVVEKHEGPTAARAQFQIGECLFAQKKHEKAVRELLRVDILYAYPEWSAAALFEAGRCFEKLGKPVEARSHFKQVVDRHTKTRWAKMASQRLTELSASGLPGRP